MSVLGMVAGAAAGFAQAKRQKKMDEQEKSYMDAMKDFRTAQAESIRSKMGAGDARPKMSSLGSGDYVTTDADGNVVQAMAAGGLVGPGEKQCDFFSGSSNDGGWQKQSYKK